MSQDNILREIKKGLIECMEEWRIEKKDLGKLINSNEKGYKALMGSSQWDTILINSANIIIGVNNILDKSYDYFGKMAWLKSPQKFLNGNRPIDILMSECPYYQRSAVYEYLLKNNPREINALKKSVTSMMLKGRHPYTRCADPLGFNY